MIDNDKVKTTLHEVTYRLFIAIILCVKMYALETDISCFSQTNRHYKSLYVDVEKRIIIIDVNSVTPSIGNYYHILLI